MLKKLIRKIYFNPYSLIKKNDINFGKSILTKEFDLIDYHSVSNLREKCSIGNDNILGCKIIFESKGGRITIGDNNFIGGNTKLISAESIEIGNYVTIAWNVTIYDHNSHSLDYKERILDQEKQVSDWKTGNFVETKNWEVVAKGGIVIEDHAWIGFDAVILKGVKIGKGAIVGARSVVTKDVPPWTIVAGNPAKKVRELKPKEN